MRPELLTFTAPTKLPFQRQMQTLRYLYVEFSQPLPPYKTQSLRGAMAHKVGLEHDWYHNHNNTGEGPDYYYRYPLIQYKSNGERPVVLYLGDAVEEAHHFFSQADWDLTIDGELYRAQPNKLEIKEFGVRILDEPREYRLLNWLPLNQDNFQKYQVMEHAAERLEFLEDLLANHILVMGKGIGWQVEDAVIPSILEIVSERYVHHKRQHVLAFTLRFKVNVFLPDFVGLGRSVSHGFGVVRRRSGGRGKD